MSSTRKRKKGKEITKNENDYEDNRPDENTLNDFEFSLPEELWVHVFSLLKFENSYPLHFVSSTFARLSRDPSRHHAKFLYLLEKDTSATIPLIKKTLITDQRYYLLYNMIKSGKIDPTQINALTESFTNDPIREIFFEKLFNIVDENNRGAFTWAAVFGYQPALKQFYDLTIQYYKEDDTTILLNTNRFYNALYCQQFGEANRFIKDVISRDDLGHAFERFQIDLIKFQPLKSSLFIPQSVINRLLEACVIDILNSGLPQYVSRILNLFSHLDLSYQGDLLSIVLSHFLSEQENFLKLFADLIICGDYQPTQNDINWINTHPEFTYHFLPILQSQFEFKALIFFLICGFINLAAEVYNTYIYNELSEKIKTYENKFGKLCFALDEKMIDSVLPELIDIFNKHLAHDTPFIFSFFKNNKEKEILLILRKILETVSQENSPLVTPFHQLIELIRNKFLITKDIFSFRILDTARHLIDINKKIDDRMKTILTLITHGWPLQSSTSRNIKLF